MFYLNNIGRVNRFFAFFTGFSLFFEIFFRGGGAPDTEGPQKSNYALYGGGSGICLRNRRYGRFLGNFSEKKPEFVPKFGWFWNKLFENRSKARFFY
jgi:hypothetical protein